MRHQVYLLIFTSFASISSGLALSNLSDTNAKARLKKDLFANDRVDPHIPPVNDHTKTISMTLAMETIHIQSLDEARGILALNSWLKMKWMDTHFQWNPKEYGGVTVLRLPHNLIWKPDVTLYNSAHGKEFTPLGDPHVLVFHDGTVMWIPPATFQSSCPINHKKFPFDSHICTLKFGSWTLDGAILDIHPNPEHNASAASISTTDYMDNEQWHLEKVTSEYERKEYECCPGDIYPSLTYKLHLKRRSSYYISLLVMPLFGSILLTLSIFWLPPKSSGKVVVTTFVSALQFAILLYLVWKIPPGSDHPPNIITYIGYLFSLSTTAIIISIFTIHMAEKPSHEKNPKFLSNLPKGRLAKIFCLGTSGPGKVSNSDKQLVENSQIEMESPLQDSTAENSNAADWEATAKIVDRMHFVVFLLSYIIFSASCFL